MRPCVDVVEYLDEYRKKYYREYLKSHAYFRGVKLPTAQLFMRGCTCGGLMTGIVYFDEIFYVVPYSTAKNFKKTIEEVLAGENILHVR